MTLRLLALGATAAALTLTAAGSAGSAPPKPRETATLDGVQARLFYGIEQGIRPVHLRLEIWRQGVKLLDEKIPPYEGLPVQTSSHGGKSVSVRDLDGDGVPEVLLDVNSGGVHCCELTRVYRFRSPSHYAETTRVWGEDIAVPDVRDVDGDGRPEFLSRDSRLEDLDPCGGFACIGFPARIWDYSAGRFVDVTRRFPGLVATDAAGFRKSFAQTVKQDPRGMAAAWAADEASLGQAGAAHAQLVRWSKAGRLRCAACGTAQYGPTGPRFVAKLWRFLHRLGYLR